MYDFKIWQRLCRLFSVLKLCRVEYTFLTCGDWSWNGRWWSWTWVILLDSCQCRWPRDLLPTARSLKQKHILKLVLSILVLLFLCFNAKIKHDKLKAFFAIKVCYYFLGPVHTYRWTIFVFARNTSIDTLDAA